MDLVNRDRGRGSPVAADSLSSRLSDRLRPGACCGRTLESPRDQFKRDVGLEVDAMGENIQR